MASNGHSNGNGAAKSRVNANLDAPIERKYGDMRDYMAASLFQPHKARQAIRDAHAGKIPPLLGWYHGLAATPITRWVTPMHFDAVWIDWEHSACNVETMTQMVHDSMFISGGRTIPFVRVPGHDHAAIGYALDAGASIVIPQVETVEEAKHVLSAAKYGAVRNGTRSAPPARLMPFITDQPAYGTDVWQSVNDQAAVMIQIESLAGIQNLDAILTECPDIDAVWLGSLDARISMGLPAGMGVPMDEPEWQAAQKLFFDTVKKHDKPYAGFSMGGGEQLKKDVTENNMCMCWISFDCFVLYAMNQQLIDARAALKPAEVTKTEGAKVEGEAAERTVVVS